MQVDTETMPNAVIESEDEEPAKKAPNKEVNVNVLF